MKTRILFTIGIFLIGVITTFKASVFVNAQTDSQEPTVSDPIRQKVEEKLKESRNKLKAYFGTITDKTNGTVQIRSEDGEIQQISVQENATTLVKTGKNSTTIKYADLAIGDFIAALGYIDPNNTIDALRILVTDTPSQPEILVLRGNFLNANSDYFLTDESGNVNYDLNLEDATFSKEAEGVLTRSRLAEFDDGDKVLVTAETVDNEEAITVRRLVLLASPATPTPSPTDEPTASPTPNEEEN